MKDPKALWAWVGGAVVVIVVVVGIVWRFYGAKAPTSLVAVHAPAGQLVPGFPQGLVAVDNATQMRDSYSISYSTSTNQYTAEWNSSSSVGSLYTKYLDYEKTNGWTITNQADYPTLKAVYATNAAGTETVSINISSRGNGSKVAISYVAQ